MFDKKRGLAHLGLGLLICGACACEQNQQSAKPIDLNVDGFDGLSPTHFDLLTTGCTIIKAAPAAGATPAVLGSVSFTVATGETLYLFERLADGQVVANASIDQTTTECAFPTTYKINVASDSGDDPASAVHKVFLDFNYGSFAMATAAYNSKSPAGTGPNIVIALAGIDNKLLVRGTSHPDIFTFGSVTTGTSPNTVTTTYGSFAFGSLVTPKTGPAVETAPAARTFPDLSATGLTAVTVSTGAGNDVITGQGGLPIGQKAGVGSLDGAISLTVYGGAGDDIITSGAASTGGTVNHLYGNCGNDTFLQQLALATDVITGSNGTGCTDTADTVDYSIRVNPLKITLGDSNYQNASNATILAAKKTLMSNNDGFTLNDGTHSVAFEYQATALATSAVGSIKVNTMPVDNETVTVSNGTLSKTFELVVTAGAASVAAGNTAVDIKTACNGTMTVACAAAKLATVIGTINGITAAAPSATPPGLGLDTTVLTNATTGTTSKVILSTTSTHLTVTGSGTAPASTTAIGSIQVATTPVDGTTFTVNDGVNPPVTFEYAVSQSAASWIAASTTTNNVIDVFTTIGCAALTGVPAQVDCVATATATAYNAFQSAHSATLLITAAAPSVSSPDTVVMTNPTVGPASKVVLTAGDSHLTVLGSSGTVSSSSTGLAGFIPTGGKKTIDIHASVTASDVATATSTAILLKANGLTVDGTSATANTLSTLVNGPLVTISFPQVSGVNVAKPAGAALTKNVGVFSVTDFTATSAPTAVGNDGEIDPTTGLSIEFDDLDVSIQNVVGGAGNDTIDASISKLSNHILYGMGGNDVLIGSDLVDTLYGGWGNDSLYGGKGADVLVGGDGNDTLQGGTGNDNLKGDDVNCPVATVMAAGSSYATLCSKTTAIASLTKGVNTLDYADRGKNLTVDLSALATLVTVASDGTWTCGGTIGESGECDLVTNVQNLRGGMGDDTLSGDSNANVIYGGIGDDTIVGGLGGSDAIYGEDGDDTINNSANTSAMGSVLSGGNGVNHITSGSGANYIDDSSGATGSTVTCASIDDVVMTSGNETLSGCGSLTVH